MGFLRFIRVIRKKVKDPYDEKHYSWRTLMVADPTYDTPFPSILMTLSNGHRKIMLRFNSVEAYEEAFRLEGEERVELWRALQVAEGKVQEMIRKLKMAEELQKRAKPGDRIVNMETGELLSEIEKYLKGKSDGE